MTNRKYRFAHDLKQKYKKIREYYWGGRATIWANSPQYVCRTKVVTEVTVNE